MYCLAASIWSEEKAKLAREWLESKEWSRSSVDSQKSLALAKEANDLARSANDIARHNNTIARRALMASAIAVLISILGLILQK